MQNVHHVGLAAIIQQHDMTMLCVNATGHNAKCIESSENISCRDLHTSRKIFGSKFRIHLARRLPLDFGAAVEKYRTARKTNPRNQMLGYAILFFFLAIVAGLLGFAGVAGASGWIAQILFFLFFALFVVSMFGARTNRV